MNNLLTTLFIMFRTVFFAVLAALVVYKIIDHLDLPALSEKAISTIISIIIWGFKIFIVWALIWLVYYNRWTIVDLFESIQVLLIVTLIFLAFVFIVSTASSYLKFRLRKKAWLLKKTDKFSLWSDDTKCVKNLSKKDKELDDKLSTKASWCWLRVLISIPLLILIGSLVLLGYWFIEVYL